MRATRTKLCAGCQQAAPVLFRVQYDASQAWIFVCPACLPTVKENNPHYAYGGTWKASKK
ncbi:MAG: hypothetical protein HC827_15685 [Cyanobacteria bacterium RM1_2_2]|nr:hypothetical protein [Leptolyngbyaceae cyanobacterium SM1_4_3]NJO79800.1 hypothetical protein [Cyanobacteria bacterium RM1_2_2]